MRAHGFHRGMAAVLSLTLAAASAPSLAFADDVAAPAAPAAPTPEQLEEARANFKAGLQLEKDGKYDEALPVFAAVAAVKASAQVKFHIGLCNEKLGHIAAAAAAYEAAAEQAKKDGNAPEVLKVAPDLARKLRDKLPLITFGFVGDVYPDTLTIDGQPVDLKNLKDIPIDPGAHVVIAKKGDEEKRSDIKVTEGDRKVLRFKLGAANGENATFTDSAERVADKPKEVEVKPASPKLVTVGWVVTGLGIASLGASLVFYGIRGSKIHDLEQACDGYRCPGSAQSTIDSAQTMTTLSRVTLGVGVGAAATGVVMLVMGYGKKAEPEAKPSYARVVPWAPNTQVGLGIEGAF